MTGYKVETRNSGFENQLTKFPRKTYETLSCWLSNFARKFF